MTAQQIHSVFISYLVANFGSDTRANWYIGIASDIEQRLFGDHNVDRNSRDWIWREAFDANHARTAENLLLDQGYDGGSGGGDHATVYVYAFRKNLGTVR